MIIADINKKDSIEENLATFTYEVGTRFEEQNIAAAEHFSKILSLLRKPKVVNELGCGDGAANNWFFDNGFQIDSAIDINKNKLKNVKTNNKFLIDINDFVTRADKLNNVFTHHSLEHTIDAMDTLDKIGNKMIPGAIFYAVVPANDYLHSVHHFVFEDVKELLPLGLFPLILTEQTRSEPEYLCVAMKRF
jgi:SAM-dependent methyltransferase